MPSAVKALTPYHWTAREFLGRTFKAKDESEINVQRDMVCKGVCKQCQMSI